MLCVLMHSTDAVWKNATQKKHGETMNVSQSEVIQEKDSDQSRQNMEL